MTKKQNEQARAKREAEGNPKRKYRPKEYIIRTQAARIKELEEEVADLRSPAQKAARLAELEAENARLQRLLDKSNAETQQLLQQRRKLWDMAAAHNLVEARPEWAALHVNDPTQENVEVRDNEGVERVVRKSEIERVVEAYRALRSADPLSKRQRKRNNEPARTGPKLAKGAANFWEGERVALTEASEQCLITRPVATELCEDGWLEPVGDAFRIPAGSDFAAATEAILRYTSPAHSAFMSTALVKGCLDKWASARTGASSSAR